MPVPRSAMTETNGSANLNTKNGNFICGVVEGTWTGHLPDPAYGISEECNPNMAYDTRVLRRVTYFFVRRFLWSTMDYRATKGSLPKVSLRHKCIYLNSFQRGIREDEILMFVRKIATDSI